MKIEKEKIETLCKKFDKEGNESKGIKSYRYSYTCCCC